MAGEKALLGVDEALERILAGVRAPMQSENLPLADALGRTLTADVSRSGHSRRSTFRRWTVTPCARRIWLSPARG